MTTLISFLGKGRYEKDGYRTAKYRFDGAFAREVPFFGMALDDYLKPDRLILVGTSGSMGERLTPDTPRATRRPLRTCGSTVGPASRPQSTWPPSTSCMAGAEIGRAHV